MGKVGEVVGRNRREKGRGRQGWEGTYVVLFSFGINAQFGLELKYLLFQSSLVT